MNVLLASVICPEAVKVLQQKHKVFCGWDVKGQDFMHLVSNSEVVVFRSGVHISAEVMRQAPSLRLLVRAGAGLDNLDTAYAASRKITLISIPSPGGRAVAELSIGLMLMLARRIMVADQAMRQGRWLKHSLNGCQLQGKTLGIVGAGRIGSQVGQIATTLEMHVSGCVARPTAERIHQLACKGIRLTSLTSIMEQSDFISIHLPLTSETTGLIDRQMLSRVKPGAYLLNLGRGEVVDEESLLQALTRPGGLAGAALDVHCREGEGAISLFAGLPNVVLTPHIGSTTIEAQQEIGRQVVAAIETYTTSRFKDSPSSQESLS